MANDKKKKAISVNITTLITNLYHQSLKKNSPVFQFLKQYYDLRLNIYNLSIAAVLVGLFFSRALLSNGFMLFVVNWVFEGDYKKKWQLFKLNKGYFTIALIAAAHLIGLIHTQNMGDGLKDLQIKFPLLFIFFFSTSPKLLSSFKISAFLLLFVISATVSSIIGFVRFELFLDNNSIEDLYKMVILGQNIQVSLFVCMAIGFIIYFLFFDIKKKKLWQKMVLSIALLWLVVYVYLLNSYTGYIVLFAVLLYSFLSIVKRKNRGVLIASVVVLSLGSLGFGIYIHTIIAKFKPSEPINYSQLPRTTKNGNLYTSDTKSTRLENGHYIDILICREELRDGWNKKSELDFDGLDNKGQELVETLIRYISSKGFTKDSAGLVCLSQNDIKYIENGCANYLYTNKYSLESRVYNVYWQLNKYSSTGNSTAQSFSQRVDFLKASLILAKENFWFGVGTGDVMDCFKSTLFKMGPKLDPAYYNRVHNQFIVEFIALGVFGFLVFLFLFFYPIFKFKIWKNYLLSSFYIIILLSFFTDNPLETQLGVGFFVIFYCILFFRGFAAHEIERG